MAAKITWKSPILPDKPTGQLAEIVFVHVYIRVLGFTEGGFLCITSPFSSQKEAAPAAPSHTRSQDQGDFPFLSCLRSLYKSPSTL